MTSIRRVLYDRAWRTILYQIQSLIAVQTYNKLCATMGTFASPTA